MIVGYLTPEIWSAIWKLVLTMVLYTALTVITFGIKVPSGLFIPTMTTGSSILTEIISLTFKQRCNIWSIDWIGYSTNRLHAQGFDSLGGLL